MTLGIDDASDRLNALLERRSEVVQLAQVASLAVRIEPHLLRQLRVRCVPGADVGAEADLWFSSLVESRGADAIVLDAPVVRLLRERLAGNPERLQLAAALTAQAHEQTAPALRLEEHITAIAAMRGDAAVAEIDDALRPAVRAMRENDRRSREIARWWMRAAPRLDPVVWRSENAVALLLSASALLRRVVLPGVPQPADGLGALAWAVPVATPQNSIEADVELDGNRLTFRAPVEEHARIRVPATQPPMVELRWVIEGRQQKAVAEVAEGTYFEFSTEPIGLALHTLRGAAYEVRTESDTMSKQARTCFVVMPFGKKTDFQRNQTFDLDKAYKYVIKPAVEDAGLQCLRADEIVFSGNINAPIFEQLLTADLVIADLTTLSPVTAYELGVRHALRAYGTIVLAQSDLRAPFGKMFAVMHYEHLGDGLDFEEVERARAELTKRIRQLPIQSSPDSPVYTFLPDLQLQPPNISKLRAASEAPASPVSKTHEAPPALATLLDSANNAVNQGDWVAAQGFYKRARTLQPNDAYILQRLVLATYRGRQPDLMSALEEALSLLSELSPETSNDPETLQLHGAVLKRMWDQKQEPSRLEGAIRAYERGFYLKNDYYNGINLAFMLNLRAATSEPAEAITDFVLARRIRRQVLAICERLVQEQSSRSRDERYWILATMAECAFGLDDPERSAAYLARADEEASADWMQAATQEQLTRLKALLAESPLRFITAAA